MAVPHLDHASIFAAIRARLHSPRPVAERMAAVITLCERSVPHPVWAALRELPYDQLEPLREWLRRLFEEEPPAVPLAGLWVGIHHPIRGGVATTDLRLRGSTRFTDDGELDWATRMEYRPAAASAHSAILRAIHGTPWAEWPLGLAYAAFATQHLLSEIEPAVVLRGSTSVGVAVGFDAGDFLLVGRLRPDGLTPIGGNQIAEPGAAADRAAQ